MTNERTYVERFDSGLDSRPLLELADAEIEELKHDNERLMKSLNAEVNAHEPSDDPISYSVSDAIRIAGLWRAGKMIGGDEDGVRDALLAEIERLNSLNRASERWDCKCDNTDCPYCGPRLAESRSGSNE